MEIIIKADPYNAIDMHEAFKKAFSLDRKSDYILCGFEEGENGELLNFIVKVEVSDK